MNHSPILLGTSSFTADGWQGSFYPRGMKPSDYLAFYAERFHSVEVDSTFYACPTARTVENWKARTPEDFIFSVKVPQTITHEKVLWNCAAELKEFLDTMSILGDKLGPMVFQFPFFDKWKIKDRHEFTDRLIPFLKKLPIERKFAIEIRNKKWLDAEFAEFVKTMDILGPKLGPMVFQFPYFDKWKVKDQAAFLAVLVPFLKKLPADHKSRWKFATRAGSTFGIADVLREHKVALVLQDLSNMPGPVELAKKFDPVTTDWTYIRWLGDRKGIEKITTTWDKTVVDRTEALSGWVDYCYQIRKRGVMIYAYANNHYQGHGPATVARFLELWSAKGLPEMGKPRRLREPSLFD